MIKMKFEVINNCEHEFFVNMFGLPIHDYLFSFQCISSSFSYL